MQQQVFEFVQDGSQAPPFSLDPRIEEEVVRLMAAAILAVLEKGTVKSDGDTRRRQDQD